MKRFHVELLYLYKFMGQCLPIYAFYTILFIERGQSLTDIALLIALWSVFTIVAEVPSGVLADRWNRRNMLALAALLQGFCFTIWFFSHTFLMFSLGFAFWAVACAFISGTEEGLIYDNLKSEGCEGNFIRVYGKAQFCANAGTVAGIASAGIIASFVSTGVIALISATLCFVNFILALQIREKNYYSERLDEKPASFFDTIKEVAIFIKGSAVALVSILFLVLFANLGEYLNEYDALIINNFQLSHIWVSAILTVRYVFVALGDVLAPIVQKKISSIQQIFLLNSSALIILLSFSVLWNQYAILLFGVAFMLTAITRILLINALQSQIKEEGRATVMSFLGVSENGVMICFSLLYALLTGMFALQQVYIIISVYGMLGGLCFCIAIKILKSKI